MQLTVFYLSYLKKNRKKLNIIKMTLKYFNLKNCMWNYLIVTIKNKFLILNIFKLFYYTICYFINKLNEYQEKLYLITKRRKSESHLEGKVLSPRKIRKIFWIWCKFYPKRRCAIVKIICWNNIRSWYKETIWEIRVILV